MLSSRRIIIGHRGAPGYRPEHTRSSYELAIAMGVDAVEPDIVATRDGVLVIRHENEISTTTDVADHPEFAARRTTKVVDGERLTGWFTEDFTWDELSTLTCRERIPHIRTASAAFDDTEPMLRLVDLLGILDRAEAETGRRIVPVIEVKHATYFAAIGLDLGQLLLETLTTAHWGEGDQLIVVESFEQDVLRQLRDEGLPALLVALVEDDGIPADVAARGGTQTYRDQYSVDGMQQIADDFDGISFDRMTVLAPDGDGRATGSSDVVQRARELGLWVFVWTCRPENAFLTTGFREGEKTEFGDYEGEWQMLLDAGVDGFFVDHADLGVAFFSES